MATDDWVLFFAEAVKRQQRESTPHLAGRSDRDVVTEAHGAALATGACERRAWNAAVGAYLERHPGTGLYTAERMVSCLIRPQDGEPRDATGPA